jgi:non-ribosomal peptide synthetase component F
LESQDKEKARNYWQRYLEGYDKTSWIPRKSEPGIHDKVVKTDQGIFRLDEKRTSALKELSASHNVTLNTVIHAVWGILLGKYSGKKDVVFGAVVSGRPSEIIGIESIIGLFTNTVPIRIVYEDKTGFSELIGKVQEESIASKAYHYFQLAEIQALSPLRQHLFDHILEFGNYPVVEQIEGMFRDRERGRKERMFEVFHVEAKNQNNYNFDLIITADECLVIRFRYNNNVYDSHFVKRISLHLEEIYRQVLENPRVQMGDIKISHDLLAAQSARGRNDQADFDF